MVGSSKMTAIDTRGTMLVNEPMSAHTSWRVGGTARRFYIAEDISALSEFMMNLPIDEEIFWLGLGSNTLVRDGGFSGTVIAMQGVVGDLDLVDDGTVRSGASVSCAKLARFCASNHLSGADFFAGIPGLLGGALAMNAGAFGDETWNHVIEVETLSRDGKTHVRKKSDFEVGYRQVIKPAEEWFISALLRFEQTEDEEPQKKIKSLLAKRAESQPIGVHSCGSVFKNPPGHHAAELIDRCQLKGLKIGGAIISEKHANFIINEDSATAEDIEQLIELIQKKVKEEFGVDLEPEVKIIGERL